MLMGAREPSGDWATARNRQVTSPSQDTHTHNLEMDSDWGGQPYKQITHIE